jgi:mRNA interferase YafQ
MKNGVMSTAYKRDVRRAKRQGKDLSLLGDVVNLLLCDSALPPRLRDHVLKGNWSGHRELHIESDWLLIYRVTQEAVYLDRTGSHAELFQL